jgi:hypothetical protein
MTLNLSDADIAEVFGDADPRKHESETQQRWGNTDAYRESARKTSSYSKEDWQRIQTAMEAVVAQFVAAKDAGLAADSAEAMAAAELHRLHICEFYYDCTYDIHTGLAEMYVADARFTEHYEESAPGLAQFVSDAIHANAIAHS